MRAGGGSGEARWIIDTTQGVTSCAAAGRRTMRTLSTLPRASISVSVTTMA
jgi:hypothetical protein